MNQRIVRVRGRHGMKRRRCQKKPPARRRGQGQGAFPVRAYRARLRQAGTIG